MTNSNESRQSYLIVRGPDQKKFPMALIIENNVFLHSFTPHQSILFPAFLSSGADQKHRGLKNTGKALLESHASPALVIGGSAKDCIEP